MLMLTHTHAEISITEVYLDLNLHLHMSLFQQRLVAVGGRPWNIGSLVFTLSPKSLIQKQAVEKRKDTVTKTYQGVLCRRVRNPVVRKRIPHGT